ncbi:MAG: glycosyltransferase family 39 protein [Candidatus Liptonbacteria bacterium]|nr:glycosyltransferase family 39 protein [Candidatus Liptonbacteria bacterium]
MSRNAKLVLILILLLAGFLRFYHLASTPPGLYPDEAMNGNNALEALRTGEFKTYYPENNGREGFFINIQAAFLDSFGATEPWVLRLPSALFGLLTVLGVFFLARELFSTQIGLLSSLLLATSVWHIIFSRIGFRAIMAPFFLVWAIYFLLRAFRAGSKFHIPRLQIGGQAYSIFAGVLFGAGFHTYIAYRVSPVLILIIILWCWQSAPESRKQILRASCFFILASFIVALPLGLYYLNHPADFLGRTAQVSVFSSPTPLHDLGSNILKTAGMFNFEGDGNWRHNFAGRPELFWPVGIFFLAGLVLGIRTILRKPSSSFSFFILFSWLLLAALPVVISNEGLPHALRAILMIPPVIILAAVGGVALYNMVKKKTPQFFLHAAAVIVIVIVMVEAYSTYFTRWANSPNVQGAFAADYVAIGRAINELPKEAPKYVIVEASGVDVRGIPMPAQTVMFITDSFLPETQKLKNIRYILPSESHNIPENARIFYIR